MPSSAIRQLSESIGPIEFHFVIGEHVQLASYGFVQIAVLFYGYSLTVASYPGQGTTILTGFRMDWEGARVDTRFVGRSIAGVLVGFAMNCADRP